MPATPHHANIASDTCHQLIAFETGAVLSEPPRGTSVAALVFRSGDIVSSIVVQMKFGFRAGEALGG